MHLSSFMFPIRVSGCVPFDFLFPLSQLGAQHIPQKWDMNTEQIVSASLSASGLLETAFTSLSAKKYGEWAAGLPVLNGRKTIWKTQWVGRSRPLACF